MGTLGISWARAGSFFHPWATYGEKTLTALPSWIDREAWDGYVDMRKAIKKPLTPRAEKLVIHTLYQLKERGHDPNAALDESSVHNWLDIYPPKAKDIPNMKRETYEPEAPMTAEEKAKADEARGRVMQLVGKAFKRAA